MNKGINGVSLSDDLKKRLAKMFPEEKKIPEKIYILSTIELAELRAIELKIREIRARNKEAIKKRLNNS